MRSLLVSSLHFVFSSSNRHYEMILMRSCDLISGMASKTLFNLGKYSFGHHNKHVFYQSSDIAKTFVLLCLKCDVDKEDNLMFHASFNVYALYCLHLSCRHLSALSQSLASQKSVPSGILLVPPYPETNIFHLR